MIEAVKDLLNQMLRAVECEREEERDRHITEIQQLSGKERERKGRALTDLKKSRVGRALGGDYLYKFRKRTQKHLPDTQISVGDQLIASQFDPLDSMNPVGTVYEISKSWVTVSFSNKLSMSNSREIRLDLHVNDLTYQRMEIALSFAKSNQFSKLHALLAGFYNVNTAPFNIDYKTLNAMQNTAVSYALGNNGYYSIQGPPGTGKTHTAVHLIKKIVESGQRVLITADSNAALDNLVRKLVFMDENPLRIGNPIRVNNDLKPWTMDYKVIMHALYKDYRLAEDEIESTRQKQKDQIKPAQKYMRGLSSEQLLDVIKTNKSQNGLTRGVVKQYKPWLKSQLKLDALYDKLNEIKHDIQMDLLASHQIIASTNSTAGSELLDHERFDWLIMDEAAQASMPSSLIPLLKAERFVLVGDHYQLPPVVLSTDAKALGLSESLMAMLAKIYPYQLTMLDVQYRMHKNINDLVSGMFYNHKLKAHKSVANRSFDDDIIVLKQVRGEERILKDTKSFYNEIEIAKVEEIVNELIGKEYDAEQIAIISPYKAQVNQLRHRLDKAIEIDTVDAFQGREKDIVILSFVRSNDYQGIGFLSDFRRLNVSISRAKQKLILIGDFDMLKEHPLFEKLLSYL